MVEEDTPMALEEVTEEDAVIHSFGTTTTHAVAVVVVQQHIQVQDNIQELHMEHHTNNHKVLNKIPRQTSVTHPEPMSMSTQTSSPVRISPNLFFKRWLS